MPLSATTASAESRDASSSTNTDSPLLFRTVMSTSAQKASSPSLSGEAFGRESWSELRLTGSRMVFAEQALIDLLGIEAAIVLQTLHGLLVTTTREKRNFRDGRYWVRFHQESLRKRFFGFLSQRTFERTVKKVKDMGVLYSVRASPYDEDRRHMFAVNYIRLLEKLEESGVDAGPFFAHADIHTQTDETSGQSDGEARQNDGQYSAQIAGPSDQEGKGESSEEQLKSLQRGAESAPLPMPQQSGALTFESFEAVIPSVKKFYLSSTDPLRPFKGDLEEMEKDLQGLFLKGISASNLEMVQRMDPENDDASCLESFVHFILFERCRHSLARIPNPENNLRNIYQGILTYFGKRWGTMEKCTNRKATDENRYKDWSWWYFVNRLRLPYVVREADWQRRCKQDERLALIHSTLKSARTHINEYIDWLRNQEKYAYITVQTALADETLQRFLGLRSSLKNCWGLKRREIVR